MLANSRIVNQTSLPFLLDNHGNGIVRLVTFNSTGRYLYLYDFPTNTYKVTNFTTILNTNQNSFNPVDKHFASIIDLNNDCFADLALLSYKEINDYRLYQIELYEKEKNNNYSLKRVVSLQDENEKQVVEEVIMLTWADVDNSGVVDMVCFYKAYGKVLLKTLINDFTPSEVC